MSGLTIELLRSEKMTVGEWERFLSQAKAAGSGEEAVVSEVTYEGTDVVCSYRVELPDKRPATSVDLDKEVRLPAWLVQDLLSVVRTLAESDGDVRGLEDGARAVLQRTYSHLLEPVLGKDLYAQGKGEDEGSGQA